MTKCPLAKLDKPFVDERGRILPLLSCPMGSCVVIESKKGAVRANHYHKTDWHYCYVLSGSIDYYERPVGSKEDPIHTHVRAGSMLYTGPMVEHAMVFTEDTVFITLGKNSREQNDYEHDVVRIDPINPK